MCAILSMKKPIDEDYNEYPLDRLSHFFNKKKFEDLSINDIPINLKSLYLGSSDFEIEDVKNFTIPIKI